MKSLYPLLITMALALTACAQSPEATLTVEVVDDSGAPVAGAEARISFEALPGTENESSVGHTDEKGHFAASGHTTGMVFYAARKQGYYENVGLRQHYNKRDAGKWIPTDIVRPIVLKRVIEPVPMYVRQVSLEVPVLNTPLGFDFEVGDWVAPCGKGKSTDLLIEAKSRYTTLQDFDAKVTITFPKRLDGIVSFSSSQQSGSVLTSPQLAPSGGYLATWSRTISRRPDTGRSDTANDENVNYIFRVRTVEDEKGNIKAANYGKIYGEISYGSFAQPKPSVGFWYYFNPKVNSRSLEFDPTKNLFPDVKMPKP